MPRRPIGCLLRRSLPLIACCLLSSAHASAQDRLKTLPGYAHYQAMTTKIRNAVGVAYAGNVTGVWAADGKAFYWQKDNQTWRFDTATRQIAEAQEMPRDANRDDAEGGFLERGRQYTVTASPDKKWRAVYKDNNISLTQADGSNSLPITTEGSRQSRIKYGTASWVYGEELEQHTAMWWSPDSKKLCYYRFDESHVPKYFLGLNQTQVQDTLDDEAYPKAGAPNPIVDLYVYDVDSKKTTRLDVRDGKPFADDTVGHYVYGVRWSPDGKQILFNRTNRRQNVMEFTACDPNSGKCRVIVRETWPASWTENTPQIRFLKDGQRFVMTSERNGYRNLYLYNLDGTLLATLTHHDFEVGNSNLGVVTGIVKIDETAGLVYYTANDGDNYKKIQLHRVRLDGTDDTRLTDPALSHRVTIAPGGKFFVDVAQTHDHAPETRMLDENGKVIATLAKPDETKLQAAGLPMPELFTYKAADGKTDLLGTLYKLDDFDPNRRYPLLVMVYAGPESDMVSEDFRLPNPITGLGFLVASFDGRGGGGRGKAFMDAVYRHLGIAEIDDQAAGVKFLRGRHYVDGARVGVEGTSYGGYASLMCLLRHPDVFQAASASSSVTDWRNYDTIYTERYMFTPQDNESGYNAGSAMTYAKDMKGRLLLYFGTADNNVHPSNTLQLVRALEQAGKGYEMQVGPDRGHSGVNFNRMLEFFYDNLMPHTTP